MYVMFVLVATGGLMIAAQAAPFATDFKIANVPVSLFGITLPALTFALSLDRVSNGIARPICGWISDHVGREFTMFIGFMLEAAAIYLLLVFAGNPVMFVLLSALVFFAWGELYALFPAAIGDIFGREYATTNYGMLYTAKGVASLLVPVASVVTAATGSWTVVFVVAALLNVIAAVMALVLLRPLRLRAMAHARGEGV
jgi:OFA family oxalate/formate antiporter-like MFS transporter